MAQELFDIGNGMAVSCNPGGKFHGWLFRKHPDGQYVSVRKLGTVAPYPPDHPMAALFVHATPKPDACEHDFQGFRAFPDGNGGERFCSKCGMGAMAHTLALGL
jgi:hypothetical protein